MDKRKETIILKVTKEEKEKIRKNAEKNYTTISDYIRTNILKIN